MILQFQIERKNKIENSSRTAWGVSPVTMDDLTSGFNIGTNYSLSPRFNEMTGFTEEEERDMLGYYASVLSFNHTVDELILKMNPCRLRQDTYAHTPRQVVQS